MAKQSTGMKMRIIHRYLGFFLAGIMAVYSLSGIVLIFRDSDFLKKEKVINVQIDPSTPTNQLGKELGMRRFNIEKEEGNIVYFGNGTYDKSTGEAEYTVKELPTVLNKMTHLHKSKSADPLFFLNIFFGLGLFFFVISSFWMFIPSTSVFKKGLYFTAGGIVLTLILLLL